MINFTAFTKPTHYTQDLLYFAAITETNYLYFPSINTKATASHSGDLLSKSGRLKLTNGVKTSYTAKDKVEMFE